MLKSGCTLAETDRGVREQLEAGRLALVHSPSQLKILLTSCTHWSMCTLLSVDSSPEAGQLIGQPTALHTWGTKCEFTSEQPALHLLDLMRFERPVAFLVQLHEHAAQQVIHQSTELRSEHSVRWI